MKIKALFILVLVGLLQNEALACSCANPRSLSLIDGHDSVFVGEVKTKNTGASPSQNVYTFSIKRKLNGALPNELDLWSEKSSAACGVNYQKNQTYLVIAYKNANKYYSGLCSSWPIDSEIAQKLIRQH